MDTIISITFPHGVFTDGESAMNDAISAMSHSNPCTVLTCVFYLFDMNVKKKVLPVPTATKKGTCSYAGFRKSFGMISEASDPKVLEET